MIPNTKIHLPFLDGIRGIAILAVFLYHSLGVSFGFDKLPWDGLYRNFDTSKSFLALYPLTYGWSGVSVFFVVSGFCIHLSHQRNKEKGWLSFANSRFFRIYPPYILAILLFSFVWPWGALKIDSLWQIAQLFSHIFTIHNFHQHSFFGINPSFWSIAVEVQLYAIYPLLLLLTGKLGWKRALMIVGALEVAIQLSSSITGLVSDIPLPTFVIFSPFAFWFSWSVGAYLCDCFMANRTSRLFRLRFDFMCVISFALPLFKPTAPFAFLAFSLLTAIAIERLMTEKWKLPQHRYFKIFWSHLSFLGIVSYSFYLFHQPIVGLTRMVFENLVPGVFIHPLFKYLVCLAWYPLILLLSHILYRLIEKPSLSLGKLVRRKMGDPKKDGYFSTH